LEIIVLTEENPYQPPKSELSDNVNVPSEAMEKLASGQKLVIYAVLVYFIGVFGQTILGPLVLVFFLAALSMSLFGLFRILKVRQSHIAVKVILFLLLFIPLINMLTLLRINANATKTLRQAGYKVGLMGARMPASNA
jgi:hypothetical protein